MKMKWILFFGVAALTACSSAKKQDELLLPTDEQKIEQSDANSMGMKKVPEPMDKAVPDWSYNGVFGAQYWGDLDPSFAMCKEGKHQSPVDLIWHKPTSKSPLKINYNLSKVHIHDNGKMLSIEVEPGNSIQMRSSNYNLKNVVVHAPSEHRIAGKLYPIEIQYIHENDKGYVSVISVLVKEGKENKAAKWVLANLPKNKNSVNDPSAMWAPEGLLPKRLTFYNYAGSITTPPCSEGVNWIVLNTAIEMSKAQITAFQAAYMNNNRPVQPMNERKSINY